MSAEPPAMKTRCPAAILSSCTTRNRTKFGWRSPLHSLRCIYFSILCSPAPLTKLTYSASLPNIGIDTEAKGTTATRRSRTLPGWQEQLMPLQRLSRPRSRTPTSGTAQPRDRSSRFRSCLSAYLSYPTGDSEFSSSKSPRQLSCLFKRYVAHAQRRVSGIRRPAR